MVNMRAVVGVAAILGTVATGLGARVTAVPALAQPAVEGGATGTIPGTVPGTRPPAPSAPVRVTLGPRRPVPNGSVLSVAVEGADPAAGPQPVALCGGGAEARRCSDLGEMPITGDGRGTRDVFVETPAFFTNGPPLDCRVTACEVQVGDGPGRGTSPVTFAPAGGARYADRVFADVDVTTGLVYGRAPSIVPLDPDGTAYGEGPPEHLLLDLYEPRGDTLAERPVIVYVHGGYFSPASGFTRSTPGEAVRFANDWTRRGYVVAAIDYRLAAGAFTNAARLARAVPAAQHDAQAAVRWLRANTARYRLSGSAIGIAGYSAGGTTALNVGYFAHDPGASGTPGESSAVAAVLSLSGTLSVPAVVGTSNYPPYAEPLRPGGPPVLMINATADRIVPYDWAVRTRDVITAAGNRCELITYSDLDHIFMPDMDHDLMPRSARFFHERLIPKLGTPSPTTVVAAVAVEATPRYTG
jgi:acetyl esterase/lipase